MHCKKIYNWKVKNSNATDKSFSQTSDFNFDLDTSFIKNSSWGLDPNSNWDLDRPYAKMLDLDQDWRNPDPQPWIK
jgi:hypothetical protein